MSHQTRELDFVAKALPPTLVVAEGGGQEPESHRLPDSSVRDRDDFRQLMRELEGERDRYRELYRESTTPQAQPAWK